MKKSKKLLLTLSTFLCVLFSNVSCMVNQNGKHSAAEALLLLSDTEQTVDLGSCKRYRPNSLIRPLSDVGNLLFEQARQGLEQEMEIQQLLNYLKSISDSQERDTVTRLVNLRLRKLITNLGIEKLTIDSEAFVEAVEDARLELQQQEKKLRKERIEIREQKLQSALVKEAQDISPKLKELLLDKTNDEFIQDFMAIYFKIIERSGANLTKERFRQNLSMLFRRMLLNNAYENSALRFSMIYSLMLQEHLFFYENISFKRDKSYYLVSTMCWVLSGKFLYDEFYKTREYFNLVFPNTRADRDLVFDFVSEEERSSLSSEKLSKFLQEQELNIFKLLNWNLYFSPDQIKNFVDTYFNMDF